jgi:rRNA maturation protein Nop10
MPRYIDVDAFRADYELREHCEECGRYGKKDCDYASYSARDFCGWLDDAPTVEAVPVVHGKWIMKDSGLWQECSVCGVAVEVNSMFMCKASEDSNFLYCPHCGSRMFGEDEKDAEKED